MWQLAPICPLHSHGMYSPPESEHLPFWTTPPASQRIGGRHRSSEPQKTDWWTVVSPEKHPPELARVGKKPRAQRIMTPLGQCRRKEARNNPGNTQDWKRLHGFMDTPCKAVGKNDYPSRPFACGFCPSWLHRIGLPHWSSTQNLQELNPKCFNMN